MIFYLLPSEKKQSSMDLIREDYFSIWEDRDKNRFPNLNPFRRKIIMNFELNTTPLAPAWRRYKGSFWDSMEFWCLPSKVQQDIIDKGIIVSPLFGLLGVNDPIFKYNLTYENAYKGKTLRAFWKEVLKDFTPGLLEGVTVFDFLTKEQRETITFPENVQIVRFEYVRKNKKVTNPMVHRAYTIRYIAEKNVTSETLEKINFYDYEVVDIKKEINITTVVMRGEGKYL